MDLVIQGNNDGWLIEQIRNESYTLQAGNKRYELSNHLGNVLAVVSDKKAQTDGVTWSAIVISATDYYPFGMAMPGRTWSASTEKYKYGFNGKETDPETGIQDYGMRWYLPNIARFPSVDPLTGKYPFYTPYQFAGNMPIKFIDLDGCEPAETPTGYEQSSIAVDKNDNHTYSWTSSSSNGKNFVWTRGSLMEFSRGTVTNGDNDLAYGDKPSYPSPEVKQKDENLTDDYLLWHFKLALNFGTGYAKAVQKLYDHFISGQGKPLVFNNESEVAGTMGKDPRFIAFATTFENAAMSYYKTNGSLNGFIGGELTGLNFSGYWKNPELATLFGRMQRCEATITSIQKIFSGEIIATFNYAISDAFGAGTDDATRKFVPPASIHGTTILKGTPFPGLIELYVLQHYRNTGDTYKKDDRSYRPFIVTVQLQRISTLND